MIRHGYAQCTACHVSPSGGGTLTPYGRQLSAELLSTWARPGEGQFTHSKVGERLAEKGILVGGDVRSIQTRRQDRVANSGRLFVMQANLELAYQKSIFTGVVSIGQIERPMSGVFYGNFNATKFYGMAQLTDEWSVRAGRFEPAYGLNVADHVMVIKSGLGMGQGRQYDWLETSYFTQNWTLMATAAKTLDNAPTAVEEDLQTYNAAYTFLNRFRVGGSLWRGKKATSDRSMYGAYAVLGFTKQFYSLLEFDVREEPGRTGNFAVAQLAYEVTKGVVPYVQYQSSQSDVAIRATRNQYYGAGFHFFPRPHIELSGLWNRVWLTNSN